jgi:hypothetical protein
MSTIFILFLPVLFDY